MKLVESHNEWDPLEEVIVGDLAGAMVPSWNVINVETIPPFAHASREALLRQAGTQYPAEVIEAGLRDLAQFIHILESEGVRVRRPAPVNHAAPYATPAWGVRNGYCAANPRDVFLVVGDEIIEAAMPDRSRHFESWAYRPLLVEYFKGGARWTAAPKPRLYDEQFDLDYQAPGPYEQMRYVVTECEPVFDAADFVRCGRDLFVQLSHVTNALGIEWVRRHLGSDYRIHVIETLCRQPMHIDTTIMPLAPGKLLINPEFIDPRRLPPVFATWDILVAPAPVARFSENRGYEVVSDWMSMNVLMLDEKRVVVEREQEPLIRALKGWGFEPIPCSFEHYYPFAGSFHCATLDVRRQGTLQSYF